MADDMTVHLHSLIQDMRRYLDLATFDVVVNLLGDKPSFSGRIRIPQSREDEVSRFLLLFGVGPVTWDNHPVSGWREVTFPVIPYADRGR
ncbi:hypothetical protein [Methylobacterium frigidaeris]|uniref:Uncharacterized protein n=1 Tax=Methylobacterium frigidaeris TaxID=2038277 RepID=A0AA37HG12_9HYPH|nr:hypothetical protein [Methylobacterium frigidaeris]PIK70531.1 hypothetical protein CS379_24175 [Methylobacterium frigidaeris]GJD65132.1 hypothetical protein MPEAHAMD_5319 [Methylobacterium frigidaeris]